AIRNGLRRSLGADTADLVFSSANILTLAFANSPLGLLVIGSESVILLGEVLARRAAWRRYEQRLDGAAAAEPGAVIRLEPGERAPRGAVLLEGTGTAVAANGLPVPVRPGAHVPAGARLSGDNFVLRLKDGRSF